MTLVVPRVLLCCCKVVAKVFLVFNKVFEGWAGLLGSCYEVVAKIR